MNTYTIITICILFSIVNGGKFYCGIGGSINILAKGATYLLCSKSQYENINTCCRQHDNCYEYCPIKNLSQNNCDHFFEECIEREKNNPTVSIFYKNSCAIIINSFKNLVDNYGYMRFKCL